MRITISACLGSLLFLAGCASAPVLDYAAANDTPQVVQARQVLSDELKQSGLVTDLVFTGGPNEDPGIRYTNLETGAHELADFVSLVPSSLSTEYMPSSGTHEAAWKVSFIDYITSVRYFWLTSYWSANDAQAVVDALRVLALDARRVAEARNAEDIEKLRLTCGPYIAGKNWPPMPEEAREHKVLAENAYAEHDYDKAIVEYRLVLKIYPCWPEAWRNRGLMQGESRYYQGAMNSIRHYLVLEPDAYDAQAMRDKLIIWRDKAEIPE